MNPKPASEHPFPYGYPGRSVCYFVVVDGVPIQCSTRDDLRTAVRDAANGGPTIYAVWPGAYRSDLFVIDDVSKLAEAIGVTV